MTFDAEISLLGLKSIDLFLNTHPHTNYKNKTLISYLLYYCPLWGDKEETPGYLSMRYRLNKMCHIHVMKFHGAIKKATRARPPLVEENEPGTLQKPFPPTRFWQALISSKSHCFNSLSLKAC